MKIEVKIPSMSCQGCVKRIEDFLKGINGIENFKIELSTKTATIEGKIEKNEIFERLREIGYPPQEVGQ